MGKPEPYRVRCVREIREIDDRMHKTGMLKPETGLRLGQNGDGFYIDIWSPKHRDPMTGHTLTGIVAGNPKDFYLFLKGYSYGVHHVTGITHYGCGPK